MTTEDDDGLKAFGLDGAERREVAAPTIPVADALNRDIDPDFGPRTETARQMAKRMHFGLAAGMGVTKASEFLTAEEIEEFAHSLRRPANATWSFTVGPKKVL